jgi:hypothetical protein
MKRRDEKAFIRTLNQLLQAHNRHFQGIRLRCRHCGAVAFAASTSIAETFGWSQLRQERGPNYRGLCVECRGKRKPQKH